MKFQTSLLYLSFFMPMNVRNVFSIILAGLLLFSASWGTAHAQDVTQNNHLEYAVISPSSFSTGFNVWFRRAMDYNSYDVSYSFYANRETGYKYLVEVVYVLELIQDEEWILIMHIMFWRSNYIKNDGGLTSIWVLGSIKKMLATKHIDGLAFDQVNISYI